MNQNSNRHFLVSTDTGEVFAETCRSTLGGHLNLTKRVAKRLGGVDTRCTQTDHSDVFTFTVLDAARQPTGASFTTQEVNKL